MKDTTNKSAKLCRFCHALEKRDPFCCAKLELEVLRGAVHDAIRELDTEARAPVALGVDGTARDVIINASGRLKQAVGLAA